MKKSKKLKFYDKVKLFLRKYCIAKKIMDTPLASQI